MRLSSKLTQTWALARSHFKNIDTAVMALKERGVKVGTPRTEGESTRFVSFWDSEGNTLGLEETR
jgi:predicted enzyme related to lactoylglutathione lyase